MEDDQRCRRAREYPQQPVVEVRAQDRVRRDPSRIIIGEPGQQTGPDDGDERYESCVPIPQPGKPALRVAHG
jgi:hypothetical protein